MLEVCRILQQRKDRLCSDVQFTSFEIKHRVSQAADGLAELNRLSRMMALLYFYEQNRFIPLDGLYRTLQCAGFRTFHINFYQAHVRNLVTVQRADRNRLRSKFVAWVCVSIY